MSFKDDNMEFSYEEKKNELTERKFKGYNELFDGILTFQSREVMDHSINLRLPKQMNKLIDEEIKSIQEEIGVKVSKNELINIILMTTLNYGQKEDEPKRFYRKKNESYFKKWLLSSKDYLIEKVKTKLYSDLSDSSSKYQTKARLMHQKRVTDKLFNYEAKYGKESSE